MKQHYDAVVVGGGLGGLAAADRLFSAGRNVMILEATSRAGGRTRSTESGLADCILDFGAEFVGANQPRWQRLAKRFSIPLAKADLPDLSLVQLDGREFRGAQLARLVEEVQLLTSQLTSEARRLITNDTPWALPHADDLDHRSLSSGIDSINASDLAKQMLKLRFEHSEAAPTQLISWLGQLCVLKGHGFEQYWDETEAFVVPNGTEQLAKALCSEIPSSAIRYGEAVTTVEIFEDGCRVTSHRGESWEAEWCILAVPSTQWEKLKFQPSLPTEWRVNLGPVSKTFLDLGCVPWQQDEQRACLSTDPPGHLWPTHGPRIVEWYTGGPSALSVAALTTDQRVKDLCTLTSIAEVGSTSDWRGCWAMDWSKEPFVEGGYSYARLGKIVELGDKLTSGLGRLQFAGEHASIWYTGYMEGALESGLRAANRVLGSSSSE